MPVIFTSLEKFVPIERPVREALIGARADFRVEDVFYPRPLEIQTNNSPKFCFWETEINICLFSKGGLIFQGFVFVYCSASMLPLSSVQIPLWSIIDDVNDRCISNGRQICRDLLRLLLSITANPVYNPSIICRNLNILIEPETRF